MPSEANALQLEIDPSVDPHIASEQMLAGVMHDIRTPLQIIAMGTDLISATAELSAAAVLTISRMRRAMERVVEMLDAVIDLSGRQTRPLQPIPRAITIDALLENAVAMMRPIAEHKRIVLRVDNAVALGELDIDQLGLMRIFTNLIGNAIKFSPSGSEINILARREHAYIRFGVRDQGPGIAAADLGRIFDRCWQAIPHDGRGLGLGLSIVKQIVEINGGTVGAASVLGRGAEIYFTVPVVASDVKEKQHAGADLYFEPLAL